MKIVPKYELKSTRKIYYDKKIKLHYTVTYDEIYNYKK